MKTLQQVKQELKEILPNGIDLVLSALKTFLLKGSDIYNDVILLEGRYRDVTGQMVQGVISNEDAQLAFNKLRKDILTFIDQLLAEHLASGESATETPGDIYNGELLYRIPKTMTREVEEKCIVRLAFNKKALLEGLEQKTGDVMKDIRISDVMGVELLDPSGSPAFAIRTISDQVQWVERDLPTEWIFYVKALKEGVHALALKISVIEIKDGIERKRNVVLEENVEILASAPTRAGGANGMEKSGYFLSIVLGDDRPKEGAIPPGLEEETGEVHVPKMIETERKANGGGGLNPAPSPGGPAKVKSRFNATKILSALVVLFVATWAIVQFITPNYAPGVEQKEAYDIAEKKNTRAAYEYVVREFPGTEQARWAVLKLDSIETAIWQTAANQKDTVLIRDYIRQYPSGNYLKEAEKKIIEFRDIRMLDRNIIQPDTKRLRRLNRRSQ